MIKLLSVSILFFAISACGGKAAAPKGNSPLDDNNCSQLTGTFKGPDFVETIVQSGCNPPTMNVTYTFAAGNQVAGAYVIDGVRRLNAQDGDYSSYVTRTWDGLSWRDYWEYYKGTNLESVSDVYFFIDQDGDLVMRDADGNDTIFPRQ